MIAAKNMTIRCFIRVANSEDYDAIADVMFDAVRNSPGEYTQEQRQAWVPQRRFGAAWIDRLNSQTIFVAEDAGQLFGFMSLAGNGYIDFAFIRPSAQGTGLFRRLYHAIEEIARRTDEYRLWVHASLMAQPAFTAVGFSITENQKVQIGGQFLERFQMEKHLDRFNLSSEVR